MVTWDQFSKPDTGGCLVAGRMLDPATELRSGCEMWSAVRVGLAAKPQIDIHRWRSDSPVGA